MIEMAKGKGPKFTHKEKGYSTRFVGAGKKPDGTYETEEECLARIKDIFDVDDVGCIWNDERKGFEPATEIMEDMVSEEAEEEAVEEEVVEGLPDEGDNSDASAGDDVVVARNKKGESEDEAVDRVKEDHPDKEVVFEDPDTPPPAADKPIPSVDGERMYELGESQGASSLQEILDMWTWDEGDDALKAKLVEETGEALQGDNGNAVVDGDKVTVIGTSATSEMLTVGCIVFKWLNMHGLNVEKALKAMDLRHREQYDRYKHLHD